jgi:hypothetical protein
MKQTPRFHTPLDGGRRMRLHEEIGCLAARSPAPGVTRPLAFRARRIDRKGEPGYDDGMPRAPSDILMPGGAPVGTAGSRPEIRELPGGAGEARDLFDELTGGGTVVTQPGYPGVLKTLPGGGTVGFRPASRSGPPTIDVNIPGLDIDKLKFIT